MITAIRMPAMLVHIPIAMRLGAFLAVNIVLFAERDLFKQIPLYIILPGQNTAYNRNKD